MGAPVLINRTWYKLKKLAKVEAKAEKKAAKKARNKSKKSGSKVDRSDVPPTSSFSSRTARSRRDWDIKAHALTPPLPAA